MRTIRVPTPWRACREKNQCRGSAWHYTPSAVTGGRVAFFRGTQSTCTQGHCLQTHGVLVRRKGASGGKENSYFTANREARKRPVCWDGSPGGRRKLLESRIWLTGSDGTQEWSLTSLGRPSWGSPMHIPHPEVVLYESNSCLNADTDVISICVFFENNAFQKQYDSSQ